MRRCPRGPLEARKGGGRQLTAVDGVSLAACVVSGAWAAAAQKTQPALVSALAGLSVGAAGEAMPAIPAISAQCTIGTGEACMTVERTTATFSSAMAQSARA